MKSVIPENILNKTSGIAILLNGNHGKMPSIKLKI
jgi:hypothetical protein